MWNKDNGTGTDDNYLIPSVSDNHLDMFPSLNEMEISLIGLLIRKLLKLMAFAIFFIKKLRTLHKYLYDIVEVLCLKPLQAEFFTNNEQDDKEIFQTGKIHKNENTNESRILINNHILFIYDLKPLAKDSSILNALKFEGKSFLKHICLEINKEKSATNDMCCEDSSTLLKDFGVYKSSRIVDDAQSNQMLSSFEEVQSCLYQAEFITNIDHMEEIKVGPCEEELGRISKRLIKKMCYQKLMLSLLMTSNENVNTKKIINIK
ncbi:hypothetical protein CWI37_0109p0010 [Hamiltosporidium tvaerminnensis]|uniref:Uncharacterized protein n=1 Tax=Hamiltosporidium tvaerminnensis TaxID=1176355 RepID=A0A4Q9LAW8_9MICR|nr:hypothetical protein CWI37_0109p0010 [Hamiltosporidium tvaerminnensis]